MLALVSYITAIAPKSLRISTWAGAGQTYECVAYAAKLEVAVGLRLGHKRQAFWIASVFTVASFFGISFTTRLPSRGVRGPPRAVFADLGGPSCKASICNLDGFIKVKHANRSASPQTDASGRATATITIRPRASGSRYAPTATYSQRPSKLLAVDRCATAAGVDPQRWPRAFVMVAVGRAHCFGTASSPEIFRSRSAPADRGGPDQWRRAVLERWPPGIATPQPLPQPGTRRSSAPHPTPNKTPRHPAAAGSPALPPARRSQR